MNKIFLVLLGLTPFAAGCHHQSKPVNSSTANDSRAKQTMKPQTNSSKELVWATSRNNTFGFEFQYPVNFKLKEWASQPYALTDQGDACRNLYQQESKSVRDLGGTRLFDPRLPQYIEGVAFINVYDNSEKRSLHDWLNFGTNFLKNHPGYWCPVEIHLEGQKNITVDNIVGVQGFSGCCMENNKNIFFAKDDKIYEFSFSGYRRDSHDDCSTFSDQKDSCPAIKEEIYDHIISTFRFVN